MDDLIALLPSAFSPSEVAAIIAIFGGLQYVFSAAVQSLPKPFPEERRYGFWYSFAHTLAGNTGLARETAEKRRKIEHEEGVLLSGEPFRSEAEDPPDPAGVDKGAL
jgi:hypothetical protein